MADPSSASALTASSLFLANHPDRGTNILRTLREMVEDRGYTLTEEYADAVLDEIFFKEHETLLEATKGGLRLLVKHPKEDKIKIDIVREYLDTFGTQKKTRVLVVFQAMTHAARNLLLANPRFELFSEADLFRNITKHALYLKHRALSKAEIKALLDSKKVVSLDKLPLLLKSDRVAKYFGFQKGQVIEIQDPKGPTREPGVHYRVVVDK